MKGFRVTGKRRQSLVDKVNGHLYRLRAKGVNGMAYIQKRYGKNLKSITTKRLTGVISDLAEL